MPVRRSALLPVVTIHRGTLLNPELSTTSRLLYAVLLASLDEEVDLPQVASLVGLADADALQPYREELSAAGVVESGDHAGHGPVLTVHEMPLVPEQRSHPCVPCEDCGDCSCEYMKGICQACDSIRSTEKQAADDIARWKRQLDAGATYAIGQHAERLHRWNCSTLNTSDKGTARLQEQLPYAKESAVYWSRLPDLYTAEELRAQGTRKRRCATCGPDPL